MARVVRRTELIPCSVAELLEVLTSEELLREQQRLQGARDVQVDTTIHSSERLVVQVRALERIRNLVSFQPGSGEPSTITYEWDLAASRCEWVYQGPHGARLQLSGSLELSADAAGARLESEFRVSVGVPFVAGAAERVVEAFIVSTYPGFIGAVRERLPSA